jgi:hypothetical protein
MMAWVETVRELMDEHPEAVEFNRRMWYAGGYSSDENDQPDE